MIILFAVLMITLALVLYSVGVLMNWRSKHLAVTHIVILWCAVSSDAFATKLMSLAGGSGKPSSLPPIVETWHTLIGYGALALMALLSLYGTVALVQKRDDRLASFHRYAVPIWAFWVFSYVTGVYIGMKR